jgi:hypothetical protein
MLGLLLQTRQLANRQLTSPDLPARIWLLLLLPLLLLLLLLLLSPGEGCEEGQVPAGCG